MRLKTELLAAELSARVPALAGESTTNRAEVIKGVIQQHMVVEQPPANKISDEEVWLNAWFSYAKNPESVYEADATTWERFRK